MTLASVSRLGPHPLRETYSVLTRLPLVKSLPGAGIGEGSYDAVIAASALKSEVSTLLTLHPRDFAGFEGPGLRVVVPGDSMKRPRSP